MEYLVAIGLFIILAINQKATSAFGSIGSRLFSYLKIATIFRLIREVLFVNIGLLFLFYTINEPSYSIPNSQITNFMLVLLKQSWLKISLMFLICCSISFLFQIRDIRDQIGRTYSLLNVILLYAFYWITSATIFLFFHHFIYNLISFIDTLVRSHGYYLLDFTTTFNYYHRDYLPYYKGVYISIILTITFIILISNAIYKRLYYNNTFIDFITYIFLLVIFGFGIYAGLFSIINFLINYSASFDNSEWATQDKLIGYSSVRLTSILLMLSIINFMFVTIFKGRIMQTIVSSVSIYEIPDSHDKKLGDFTGIHADYFDIYYFIQLGFYILNTFVAEYLIANNNLNFGLSFLLLILPIFVDDYLAIHVYFKRYKAIKTWHLVKKHMFNLALMLFSVISLISAKHYSLLAIYILTFITLLVMFILLHSSRRNRI